MRVFSITKRIYIVKHSFCYLLLVIAFIGVGCNKKSPYSHLLDKPLPVEIEVVGESSKTVHNTYVGEIRPKFEMPLIFPLGGQITGIYVKSGDNVRAGQVIATVDSTQAKSLMESARAIYHQAVDAHARLKPLHEAGGISDVKWVEMETNLEKARSMLISATKRYEDCTMRAAQNGVVNMRNVDVGQQIGYGQSIGTLMDMTKMCVEFTVPEMEVGRLVKGQKVVVDMAALGKQYEAEIVEKSLVATYLAHTYRVKAELCSAEAAKDLLPGMICRAMIDARESNGYIISAGCVQTQQRGHSVWVLRDGRAQRVMITIDEFVENGVLVSSGLHYGDTVVSKGYQKMFNGARVTF